MKKIFAIVLAGIMMLSLAACGGTGSSTPAAASSEPAGASGGTPASSAPAASTLSGKVTTGGSTSVEKVVGAFIEAFMAENSGVDVTYEEEGSWWVAVEAFYSGRQALEDDPYRTVGRPYTTVGALVARQLGRVRVFVSGENLTDVRQARYEPVLLPARASGGRWTVSPWAPLEGRVVSVGVRLSAGRPPAGP